MKNRPIQTCLIATICCILASCAPKEEPIPTPQWSAVELLRNQHKEELSDFDKLTLAIAFMESRFKADAVGSHEDRGVLQLVPTYIAEVNRLYGTDYKPEDAFDIDKSLELYRLMQAHYNPNSDIETAIKYHNRAESYKRVVLENLAMINRMEELRAKLVSHD